jgi:predicted Zn-dependent peptidase
MPYLDRRIALRTLAARQGERLTRRTLVLLPVLAVLIALQRAPAAPAASAAQQQPSPLTGMLVTLSATAEDEEAVPNGGLVLRITLENRTGGDVADVEVHAPLPPRTVLAAAWQGTPGRNPPAVEGPLLRWGPMRMASGALSEPFTFRVVPAPGEDGAVIFRGATLRPTVAWDEPSPGQAIPPVLPLNGLWGERGLRRTALPSGLTVFTHENPESTTVAIRLAVRAGSRDENDVTRGGSHWLEHAFFLGTPRRSGNEEIFAAIQSVGGLINARTSFEWTDYFNTVPAEHFDLSLDVLADQILNSTFPRDRFDRERRVVAEEIRLGYDNPTDRVGDLFLGLVFQQSPLRDPIAGTVETVADIPIETILAYRAERYVTGNIAIAAAGRLQHDETVAKIAAAFAPLPRGPRAERPRVVEPVQTMPRRLEVGEGTRLAEILLGWPVAGDDNDQDSPALVVLESILGNTGRRMQQAVLQRGVPAAFVEPGYLVASDTGAFAVQARTQVDAVDALVAVILDEIERVRSGQVSETDVQEAVRALIGQRALTGETSLAQTGLATIEVSGILDSYSEYVARVQTVTAADVVRVARTYLDPENYSIAIVRP